MSFDLDSCAQVMDLEATLGTRDEELDALRQRLQGERTAMAAQQQSLLELRAKLLQVSLSVSLSLSLSLCLSLSLSLSPPSVSHARFVSVVQAEEGRAAAMARLATAEADARTAQVTPVVLIGWLWGLLWFFLSFSLVSAKSTLNPN
jgi:hypothetical protein